MSTPTRSDKSPAKALRATKPNAGLREEYQKRLEDLIVRMEKDVRTTICEAYKRHPPLMAMDAGKPLPSNRLLPVLSNLRKKWEKTFEDTAEVMADWFVKKIRSAVTRSQRASMQAAGLSAFMVRYDKGRITEDAFKAIIHENANLIKSIGSNYLSDVEGCVTRAVTAGRDLKGLTVDLESRYQITKRRAAFIARDQATKATENIARANDMNAGVEEGVWIHVPGRLSSRKTHKEMHGKTFKLSEGIYDSTVGRYVLPGSEPGCNCTYRPLFRTDIWSKK